METLPHRMCRPHPGVQGKVRAHLNQPHEDYQAYVSKKIVVAVSLLFIFLSLAFVNRWVLREINAVYMTAGAIGVDIIVIGILFLNKRKNKSTLQNTFNARAQFSEIYDFICAPKKDDPEIINHLLVDECAAFLGWVRREKDIDALPPLFLETVKAYSIRDTFKSSSGTEAPRLTFAYVRENIKRGNDEDVMRSQYLAGVKEMITNENDPVFTLLEKIHNYTPAG